MGQDVFCKLWINCIKVGGLIGEKSKRLGYVGFFRIGEVVWVLFFIEQGNY